MITFKHKGSLSITKNFLKNAEKANIRKVMERYAKQGVKALESATPVDTGLTSKSWYYNIEYQEGKLTMSFCNSNIQNGIPIAIILQYGHGTRNGGWVQGRDYINPVIQPIFDKIASDAWREVSR